MIFVTVGSQKFQFNRLLKAIDELIEKKIITDRVFAQIGVSDYKPKNYQFVDFITQEEFGKKIDECDIVITHAGTGVIVNALKKQKKVVAVPRLSKYGEHVDDHQIQLIKEFDELNFIEPIYEIYELESALIKVKEKKYNKYISNTDIIMKSVKDFINESEKSTHKIKILWVITGGLRRNGICVSQLEYAKRINKDKFILDVVAVHNNSIDMIKEYENAGCRVFNLPDRRKNIFKYSKELKKIIEKEKYDIIHTFGSSALMGIELKIAKKCNVKVRIAHSRNTTCDRKFIETFLRPSFDRLYNYAFACGEAAGKWLFNNKKYIVLHNGKDLKKYSFNEGIRNNIRSKYKIEDKLALGHVGNFNNQKNHKFLIDVFYEINQKNKNSVLFLMGNGEMIDEIKNKVYSLHLDNNVFFLGSVNNVEEIIQGMDVMLLPSLFEGLPNVVIEWQASGLPCIISDKITNECKVSNLVHFLSIEKGAKEWSDYFNNLELENYDRENDSKINCKLLRENGFDIDFNSKKLEDYYYDFVKAKNDH